MALTQADVLLVVSTPGGCSKENSNEQQGVVTEEQASADSLSAAEVITEDPHAVLVEFSSVVADTQEYIIKVRAKAHKFGGELHRKTIAAVCLFCEIVYFYNDEKRLLYASLFFTFYFEVMFSFHI